jgi:hypothetical protein
MGKGYEDFRDRLRRALPANRVAAIAGFLSGLATLIATLAGALPAGAATVCGLIVGFLMKAVSVIGFLRGQHLFDQSPAGQQLALAQLPAAVHPDFPVGQHPFEGPGVDEELGVDSAPPGLGYTGSGMAPPVAEGEEFAADDEFDR